MQSAKVNLANHKITRISTNLFYQTLRKFDQNASRKEKLYQKNLFFILTQVSVFLKKDMINVMSNEPKFMLLSLHSEKVVKFGLWTLHKWI